MAIIIGDATDGVRTGLAGRLANRIVAAFGGARYQQGSANAKLVNTISAGIVDALNLDKVDGTTQVSGGGGPAPSFGLFSASGRRPGYWTLAAITDANYTGVGIPPPASTGVGTRSIVAVGGRWYMRHPIPASTQQSGSRFNPSTAFLTALGNNPKIATRLHTAQVTLMINAFALRSVTTNPSWSLGYIPTIGGTNADTETFLAIVQDSRVGGNWLYGSGDGATASWLDTGIAVVNARDYVFILDYSAGGANVVFTIIDCVTGVSSSFNKSTNLPPAAQGLGPEVQNFGTNTAGSQGLDCEYVYMEQN